jgi:hypothetical protein
MDLQRNCDYDPYHFYHNIADSRQWNYPYCYWLHYYAERIVFGSRSNPRKR